MKKTVASFIMVMTTVCAVFGLAACGETAAKKTPISDQYSISYGFPEKPKIGTSTLKVNVFDKEGNKTTDLDVLASYDMPSMRGHHAYGPAPVVTNKNNDYLLPVHFAMPGDWEIVLTFQKDGKDIHTQTILLDL